MPRSQKIAFSMASLAAALVGQAFSTYVIFFYVDHLKLSAQLVGSGMILYGIWNAINDPLIGQISDRTHTRWGRRIPYVLAGAIPLGLSFILVWLPPFSVAAGQSWPLFLYFLGIIFVYDTLFTIVFLNWSALFPEMYPGLAERTEVMAWRQGLGIIGMMAGIALPPMIYGSVGWGNMGIIFGIISISTVLVSMWGSREKPEFSQDEGLPLLEALRATFLNRSFATYIAAIFLVEFVFVMLTATIPFYAKYVLKIGEFQTSLMLGMIFIVALPMVVVWGRYTVKAGALKAFIFSTLLFGVSLVPFLFVSSFLGGLIVAGLMGLGLAGLILLMDIMLSDVIDEDELKTGTRREGMYFGTNGFMVRLGISLQALVMTTVLKVSGYDPNLAVQPASAIAGLRFLMTAVPLVALIISVLVLRYYPLHGPRLEEVRAAVARLHEEKAARQA
ncbi:MAG: MFS transporter [Firmicutes bacterium]|nr:MFS transporter [Bacillota bacterium]MCL5040663.1 MFS transporter [Bacillota bacterium]